MNDPIQFTANYKHYQMTALRFTFELDRLTDQVDLIKEQAEKTSENVQNLQEIAGRIEDEVERACAAWGNGSAVVKETAKAAQIAATSGVEQAANALISRIDAATAQAQDAVTALRKAQRSVRWRLTVLALAFLAGSASTYAVARFGFDIGVESEARKTESAQSQYLSRFWSRATVREKQDFQKVMARKPQ
ncbi:hypothetical protein V0R50_06545 [Pseudomonas sp. 148P]|uniref:Uncharacterized protein n=1 Tax=Pseudomonas ulcerans TaxID=3115852 RepID=A0ABU7HMW6_9PSED|nr:MULTISPECIES: hypothetical protein [unclassified Pseudomonas]MEE1921570.1 hypothetical protein [Pseudomonas sp. 147P]MEE1932872.1 hypothetical protein [Pseudomonas sp. 148P]